MEPVPRVVMLESGGWGGLAHYSYNLCEALAASGTDVTLQTRRPFELADLPRTFALREWAADAGYSAMARAALAAVRDTGASILHLQSTISARRDLLWLQRLRWRGSRIVTTAHNVLPHDEAERTAFGMRWTFGRIYTMSDAVIVHGEDTKRQITEGFRVAERKLAVIPHGDYMFARTELEPAAAKQWMGLAPDTRLVLCFGAIREYKGIPELIDAFAAVAPDFPAARLAIIGMPIRVEIEDYRRQVERLGIGERITLRPEYVPFEDIGRYFAACDVAAYPYRNINQSGALQLAYASGRPVVATAVGEFTTTVRDQWNGLLVPPEDPAALAAALRDLLGREPAELREMGQRSRQIAEQEHGWDEVAAATARIYRLVGTPMGPATGRDDGR